VAFSKTSFKHRACQLKTISRSYIQFIIIIVIIIIIIIIVVVIIIIIIINCSWVVTQWQWLFYMYTNIKKSN